MPKPAAFTTHGEPSDTAYLPTQTSNKQAKRKAQAPTERERSVKRKSRNKLEHETPRHSGAELLDDSDHRRHRRRILKTTHLLKTLRQETYSNSSKHTSGMNVRRFGDASVCCFCSASFGHAVLELLEPRSGGEGQQHPASRAAPATASAAEPRHRAVLRSFSVPVSFFLTECWEIAH